MSVELNIMDISTNENIVVDIEAKPSHKNKKKPIIIGDSDSKLTLECYKSFRIIRF